MKKKHIDIKASALTSEALLLIKEKTMMWEIDTIALLNHIHYLSIQCLSLPMTLPENTVHVSLSKRFIVWIRGAIYKMFKRFRIK